MLDQSYPAGWLFYRMRGACSKDIPNNAPKHHDPTIDMSSSSKNLDPTTWADTLVKMPLACLVSVEGIPPLEPPSSGGNAISDVVAPPTPTHDTVPGSPGDLKIFAADQPCDTTCTITISPAPGSPTKDRPPPPRPPAPDAPALPLHPSACAEARSMGYAQHTADTCVPLGAVAALQGPNQLAAVAESPNKPFQRALLTRVPPAPKASVPCRGFMQRNRVRTSLFDG